jgi:hypothetical protein
VILNGLVEKAKTIIIDTVSGMHIVELQSKLTENRNTQIEQQQYE